MFGKIRRDLQKTFKSFKQAAHHGSVNAKYNLGALYLSGETIKLPKSESDDKIEFSYSQSYDYFK